MSNTVVIGTAFVDIKGFANFAYDPQGRNLGTIKTVHGGVGRNVAENFAKAGMPVSFAGMLEDTALGRDVERHLREVGVDLTHMVMPSDKGIGMWMVILNEHGDLAGSISRMPDLSLLEEALNTHGEDIIREADQVILEVDLNESIAASVIGMAEKYHKKVYSLVGNMSVILARPDLLRKNACFICNEIEAAKLFSNSEVQHFTPEEMVHFLPNTARNAGIASMVVTMGAAGCVYSDNTGAGICPPIPATVVDTSGAGDAFFSGTVMGLIRNMPLAQAVRYGTKLASMTIATNENNCAACPDFFAPFTDE